MAVKLSNRLSCISNMVTGHYDHIWDCCCDHGQLGLALLQSQPAATIHFVDVVKPLIDNLSKQLSEQYPLPNQWQTHCSDLNQLLLPDHQAEHLVIIAGVGGDLAIKFVKSIQKNNPLSNLEFLLCPVRHNFKVRQAMSELGLGLINETLVYDKGLFYEAIHIGLSSDEPITATGSIMWDFSDPTHQLYLQQTIAHYQRSARSNPKKYTDILKAYQALSSPYI